MADQSTTDYFDDANREQVPYAERRHDILAEGIFTADGSGNYLSNWISSSGVNTVRVTVDFLDDGESPTAKLEEAQWDENGFRVTYVHSLTIGGGDRVREDVELGTRVFRFNFSSMGNARVVATTVRKVA